MMDHPEGEWDSLHAEAHLLREQLSAEIRKRHHAEAEARALKHELEAAESRIRRLKARQ